MQDHTLTLHSSTTLIQTNTWNIDTWNSASELKASPFFRASPTELVKRIAIPKNHTKNSSTRVAIRTAIPKFFSKGSKFLYPQPKYIKPMSRYLKHQPPSQACKRHPVTHRQPAACARPRRWRRLRRRRSVRCPSPPPF
jgi:hypothetical protein